MHLCEQWWFHCTTQWGQKTLLSEHVYHVTIAFKVAEQVEQWICIKSCVKLEQSSMKTTQMIQKAAALGNWWLAASSWQGACSCVTCCAEIFGETSNHPGDSTPLQPRLGALWLLAFPKTKTTFEREEISDHQWNSIKCDGAVDGKWENWVRSPDAYFEGHWGIIALCIFFNKCLFFILYG